MTRTETSVQTARRIAGTTTNPAVKKTLTQFVEECPECGSGRRTWDFDHADGPPIQERGEYHIVAYRCRNCGERFKKLEDVTGDD